MDNRRHRALARILGLVLGALLAASGLGLWAAAGQDKPGAPAPETAAQAAPVHPRPQSGFPEKGVFKLFAMESEIGRVEYNLAADGHYERTFTLALGGQKVVDKLTVETDAAGEWRSMEVVAPTDTITVRREGDTAQMLVKSKGEKYSAKLVPGHILDDNYGPVFYSFMLRAYDLDKRGVQTFPRFIVPARIIDFDLEYKGQETREVAGRDIDFHRFDAKVRGIEIQIWAEGDFRIDLMSVPVQKAAFVREGFEELLPGAAADPLLSRPVFDVRRETVMVPMRDGVRLATDLYFPAAKAAPDAPAVPDKLPVILTRTPYKKEMNELNANFYARRGYAAAVQDCRGCFGSEGRWEPLVNEPRDGYDTIEWLAGRDWSSGKVGMIGGSYVGWVQLWAAAEKPPHLTTIIPNVAPPDPFYNMPYEYGAFFILGSIWWAEILETKATGDLSGKAMAQINDRKYEKILKSLPVIDLDEKILGKKNDYWRQWIKHNTNDDYWSRANFLDKLKTLDLPVFLQSGWFDGDGIGSKLNYAALKESGNENLKLILGPWGHTDTSSSQLGDFNFGPQAAPDLQKLYVRWFDYWLKGIDNKILDEPLVQVFVMFSNKWLKGPTYPLPETAFTKYYLGSSKGANSSKGDGTLSPVPPGEASAGSGPAAARGYEQYVYDPADPTPWPEYYFRSEEEVEQSKKQAVDVDELKRKAKAFHQSVTDGRPDILVFQTEPLDKPVSIAGPVSAVLYASTDAPDTDWYATLMDVDEKGEIFHLVRGVLRARFRNSTARPELLDKDKVYKFDLDMWQTGITFQKGHRIRVEVASAMFPMFSRNLNTGGHNETETKFRKAVQRVYHTPEYPSHVLLPLVEVK
jgi:putative CocE/NonD family hydrolase